MNERIKELATKAGMVKYPTGINISENTIWGDNNIEKFAELIVKEAGALLMSPEFIGRSDLDWSMVLNEHFGVEE